LQEENARLTEENARLTKQLAEKRGEVQGLNRALESVRTLLRDDYEKMRVIFGEMQSQAGSGDGSGPSADAGIFEPWKSKLGAGPAKMIDALLQRGELSSVQLGTLCGFAPRTTRDYLQKLKRNAVIQTANGRHSLRVP
jgi:hypothetical protein